MSYTIRHRDTTNSIYEPTNAHPNVTQHPIFRTSNSEPIQFCCRHCFWWCFAHTSLQLHHGVCSCSVVWFFLFHQLCMSHIVKLHIAMSFMHLQRTRGIKIEKRHTRLSILLHIHQPCCSTFSQERLPLSAKDFTQKYCGHLLALKAYGCKISPTAITLCLQALLAPMLVQREWWLWHLSNRDCAHKFSPRTWLLHYSVGPHLNNSKCWAIWWELEHNGVKECLRSVDCLPASIPGWWMCTVRMKPVVWQWSVF